MTWNYRLVDFTTHIAICEVYYDDNDKPSGRTGALEAIGETPDEIREDMEMMFEAFDRPTLNNDEHFPE